MGARPTAHPPKCHTGRAFPRSPSCPFFLPVAWSVGCSVLTSSTSEVFEQGQEDLKVHGVPMCLCVFGPLLGTCVVTSGSTLITLHGSEGGIWARFS